MTGEMRRRCLERKCTYPQQQNSDARGLALLGRDLNFGLSVDIHTVFTCQFGGPELSHEEFLYDRVLTMRHIGAMNQKSFKKFVAIFRFVRQIQVHVQCTGDEMKLTTMRLVLQEEITSLSGCARGWRSGRMESIRRLWLRKSTVRVARKTSHVASLSAIDWSRLLGPLGVSMWRSSAFGQGAGHFRGI